VDHFQATKLSSQIVPIVATAANKYAVLYIANNETKYYNKCTAMPESVNRKPLIHGSAHTGRQWLK